MESYRKLLLENKAWVQERLGVQPDFFEKMAHDQKPEFMWIGCSDSRVPAEDITGTEPGELFVHRNVANLVVRTDLNMLSVLQYAVEVLKVKHVIVCGHYHCGGVKNAMTNKDFGLINQWLGHIKDVYRMHSQELEAIADEHLRYDRMVELNVTEQVRHLAQTSIIQRAWHAESRPYIHGWVYDLRTGYIKEIEEMEPGSRIEDVYHYDFGGAK
jgi:carbonic anhydrase